MEPPKRAWVIKIEAGGDTLEDAISVLDHYAGSIAGGSRSSVMGGSSNCGTMSVEHDPSMTPEAFRSQLKAYVEDTRNGVPPASVPQDATEVRVWECPWKCHQILNVGGDDGLWFRRLKPDGPYDWDAWTQTGKYDMTELVGGQKWVPLHGPALAAALDRGEVK